MDVRTALLRWPSGEVAVMGAKGAVEIIFRGKDVAEQEKQYTEHFCNPMVTESCLTHSHLNAFMIFSIEMETSSVVAAIRNDFFFARVAQVAARRGFVDDIIDPALTRRFLCQDLELLRDKPPKVSPRKHSNIPL